MHFHFHFREIGKASETPATKKDHHNDHHYHHDDDVAARECQQRGNPGRGQARHHPLHTAGKTTLNHKDLKLGDTGYRELRRGSKSFFIGL